MNYFGDFESNEDIAQNFNIEESFFDDVNVWIASYENFDYYGNAFVLYKDNNGNFFEVNASHCSCFGLEGQWKPEETTLEDVWYRLKHGNAFDGDHYSSKFVEKLTELVGNFMVKVVPDENH